MRTDLQRLEDIIAALSAISAHLERGPLEDDLVFDAVRVRLIEIGEAVKDISPHNLASEPDIPWSDIARMRDHLAHRYFVTDHVVVAATIENDLPSLRGAIHRMRVQLESQTD